MSDADKATGRLTVRGATLDLPLMSTPRRATTASIVSSLLKEPAW